MKKFLFFAAIFITQLSLAQNDKKIGRYKWNDAIPITSCKIDGSARITPKTVLSISGQKFDVIAVVNNDVVIRILDYTERADHANRTAGLRYNAKSEFYVYNFERTSVAYNGLSSDTKNARIYGDDQLYFKVTILQLDQSASKITKIKGSLAAGVINFPFKYRFQKDNVDFSGAFNFGAAIGYTLPHKSSNTLTHSFVSGYSVSNVVLDKTSVTLNSEELANTNNFSAFSISLGYLVAYQRVQAGVFMGWDRIGRTNQENFGWIYQGKPWISIGFGVAVFSGQTEVATNSSTNQ